MSDFQPRLRRVPGFEPGVLLGTVPLSAGALGVRETRPEPTSAPCVGGPGVITASGGAGPKSVDTEEARVTGTPDGSAVETLDETHGARRTQALVSPTVVHEAEGERVTCQTPRAVAKRPARETSAGCGSRMDRRALRINHSAPVGIRRAHRASANADPAGAREFTARTLRILLEVLDHRRPVAQLGTLCAPALVRTVGVMVSRDHIPSRSLGTAVLTKFGLFRIDEGTSELVAMYQRGPRCLALAGRIERTAAGWKLIALRLA